jgi:hypothetical protein
VSDLVTEERSSRAAGLLRHVLEVAVVLALFAAVGAGCGWLWFHFWDQPTGVVFEGIWYPDEEGLRRVFDATAWYVALAAVGGLVTGAVVTLAGRRAPLVTLGAVLAGSVLAAWLMHVVGLHLSPANPETLAKSAEDGAKLGGRLSLEDGKSPYLAWPLGSLVALMVLNFLLSSRDQIQTREGQDPRWLSRNHSG